MRDEFNELVTRLWSEMGERGDGWRAPPTDVSETEQEIEILIDLPGVQPQALEIEQQGRQLTIRGERPLAEEQPGRTYHRLERGGGRFVRNLQLPCDIQEDQVQAEFHDGVLRIVCPKVEQAQAKRIEIKT